MWKAFQRACATLETTGLTSYDFRHSYLTVVYDETRDLRVTGKMGIHRSERTTRRYTMAAVAPHVQDAAAKVVARLASKLALTAAEATRFGRKSVDATKGRHALAGVGESS